MTRFIRLLLMAVVFSFLFQAGWLHAVVKPDLTIDSIRISVDSGDVYVRVKNVGPKEYTGHPKFGIWFNGAYKGYKRSKVVLVGHNMYDTLVCNFSDLGTSEGEGSLRIKVDIDNQVDEVSETNNSFTKVDVAFFSIKSAKIEVKPLGTLIRRGEEKTFAYKVTVVLKGRGRGHLKYRWKLRNNRFGNTVTSQQATGVVILPNDGTNHFVKTITNYHTVKYDARVAGKTTMYWIKTVFSFPSFKSTNEFRYGARYDN